MGFAETTFAQPSQEIFIKEIMDPNTNMPVRLSIATATDKEIRDNSPSMVRERVEAACRQGGFDYAGFVRSIPSEAFIFNTAIAINAVIQSNNDPAGLRHFYEQSLVDPTAHASFVAFMMGNRGATHMLTQAIPDFCIGVKGAKRQPIRPGEKIKFRTSPAFQKYLLPGIGMSVGTIASHVTSDIMAAFKSPNVALCTRGMWTKVPDKKAWETACDRAYEEMMGGRKLRAWAPTLCSLWATTWIQAAITAVVHTGAKGVQAGTNLLLARAASMSGRMVVPILLTSLRIGAMVTPYVGGAARVGYGVANLLTFMFLDHEIMAFIKPPWDSFWERHGLVRKLTEIDAEITRTEKANWKWTPRKKTCSVPDLQMARYSVNGAIPMKLVDCTEKDKDIVYLLNQYADHNKEFRKIILEGPMMELENWKDYVTQFKTLYSAAYTFNGWFVDSVASQRMLDGLKPGDAAYGAFPPGYKLPLFSSTPSNGIQVVNLVKGRLTPAGDEEDGTAVKRAISYSDRVLQGKTRANLQRQDRHLFLQIRQAMKLGEKGSKLPGEGDPKSELEQRLARFPKGERTQRISDEKYAAFEKAMYTLNRMIPPNFPRAVLRANTNDNELNKIANPFVGLFVALGNPEPLAIGMKALSDFDNSPLALDQETKGMHPGRYGIYATPRMVDFLLVSTVCGPEAAKVLTENADKAKASRWFPKFLTDMFSKEKVVAVDQKLIRAKFYPPRLTNQVYTCPTTTLAETDPRTVGATGPMLSNPLSKIVLNQWKNTTAPNFLELAKSNLKSDLFIKGQESNFEKWWKDRTEIPVNKMIRSYEGKLLKMVDEAFLPAMIGKEPMFKDPSQYQFRWSLTNWKTISAREAFLNEAASYLNLMLRINNDGLMKAYKNNPKKRQQEAERFRQMARGTFKALQIATAMVGTDRRAMTVTHAARKGFKLARPSSENGMTAQMKYDYVNDTFGYTMKLYFKNVSGFTKAMVPYFKSNTDADKTRARILTTTVQKLTDIGLEVKTHFGILNAVRLPKMKELAADSI